MICHVSPILRVSVDVIEIKIKAQHSIFAVQLVSPRVVHKNIEYEKRTMFLGLEQLLRLFFVWLVNDQLSINTNK